MKTRKDDFGLDWEKVPFERKEAVRGISEVLRKTQTRIKRARNKQEKRRFQANAIDLIRLILKNCKEEFFIDELEETSNLDEALRVLRNFFAFERVNIEKPFYLV